MAFLEQFSAAERALLVALPYRAGLWVSLSDNTGGARADAKELRALSTIIENRARGMFRSAFVHEIIAETHSRKDEWARWDEIIDRVPEECRQAVIILNKKLVPRDVRAYAMTVMAIARDVALAFREQDENLGVWGRMRLHTGIYIDTLIGRIRGEEYVSETLLNISEKEDIALGQLARALRVTEGG